MVSHAAYPALERRDGEPRPALRSPAILRDLLRDDMGFQGVVVTDALDMAAVDQSDVAGAAIAAIEAGVDLLLAGPAQADRPAELARTDSRRCARRPRRRSPRAAWRRSGAGSASGPCRRSTVVGSAEHAALARELARRSVTQIRDEAGLLPLRPSSSARLLVLAPTPTDLTPADTSVAGAAAPHRCGPPTARPHRDVHHAHRSDAGRGRRRHGRGDGHGPRHPVHHRRLPPSRPAGGWRARSRPWTARRSWSRSGCPRMPKRSTTCPPRSPATPSTTHRPRRSRRPSSGRLQPIGRVPLVDTGRSRYSPLRHGRWLRTGGMAMSLRDEIHGAAGRGPAAAGGPASDRGPDRRRRSPAGTSTWCSSPPAAAPTTPPSTPSTCSAPCTGSRSRWRRRPSPRCTACSRAWSTRWSSASRSPAARPTWWASSTRRGRRARRPSPSPTRPARRSRVPRIMSSTSARARNGRPRRTKTYTMSLLAVAMLVAAIDGGTGFAGDRATRLAALDALARGHGPGARRRGAGGGGGRRAGPASTAASCWDVASSTPRLANGRSSSRSWPRWRPIRTPRPTSSTARWRSWSRATPSWRWRRRAPRCAGMSELLLRLRDEHGVDLVVISDDPATQALGRRALPTPAAPAEWLSPLVSTCRPSCSRTT